MFYSLRTLRLWTIAASVKFWRNTTKLPGMYDFFGNIYISCTNLWWHTHTFLQIRHKRSVYEKGDEPPELCAVPEYYGANQRSSSAAREHSKDGKVLHYICASHLTHSPLILIAVSVECTSVWCPCRTRSAYLSKYCGRWTTRPACNQVIGKAFSYINTTLIFAVYESQHYIYNFMWVLYNTIVPEEHYSALATESALTAAEAEVDTQIHSVQEPIHTATA